MAAIRHIKCKNQRKTSPADAATNEIDHYLSLRVPAEFEDDPLRFWEKHQSSFPILSVVARVYLGMSATSVPVECIGCSVQQE